MEASFQQDLNSDGVIGLATTVIEATGSISLAQVADTYFLYQTGSSTGPQLNFNGAAVALGQFGAWTALGAMQSGGGYQVAWKNGLLDQYIVWNTDSGGNYLSQGSVLSGTSFALESLETTFTQDFNGDGTVGLVTTVVEASGATTLDRVANTYFLYAGGTTSGPQLKYSGAAVTTGQLARRRRSAPSRRPAAIRSPGSSGRPISTSSGPPTSAAISSLRAPWFRETPGRFNRSSPASARTSTTTAGPVLRPPGR